VTATEAALAAAQQGTRASAGDEQAEAQRGRKGGRPLNRRVLEVELAGPGSVVRGYGSRGLVESITGRPPVWRRAVRGWSVQEKTAAEVLAVAQHLGVDLVVTGPRGGRHQDDQDVVDHGVDRPDIEEPGLW
jgi:hypothetical protein